MGKNKKTVAGLMVMGLIAAAVLSSGCIGKEDKKPGQEDMKQWLRQTPAVIGEEKLGGKYNASILTVRREYKEIDHTWEQIEYTVDGQRIRGEFYPDFTDALDWIKLNTPEDAVIMGWWDYADSIRGYTGRDVVIDFASKEILDTVADYKYLTPEQRKEKEARSVPHKKIRDVATVLTTKNPQEAIEIMGKYDASYLFVHKNDVSISFVFFSALEEEPIEPDTVEFGETIVGKASQDVEIDGFRLVYSDENIKLYSVI